MTTIDTSGPIDFVKKWLDHILAFFRAEKITFSDCGVEFQKTKNGIWTMGPKSHRDWVSQYLAGKSHPIDKVFGLLQWQEGSTAAYQNYDNMGATLGTGFGARGLLPRLARELSLPDLLPLPQDAKYTQSQIDELRTVEYAKKWVCGAMSEKYRARVADAQSSIFRSHVEKYDFPLDNLAILEFLAHLSWWYPALLRKGNWPNGAQAVERALSDFGQLAPEYRVKPSRRQIEGYLATAAKHGYSGNHASTLDAYASSWS